MFNEFYTGFIFRFADFIAKLLILTESRKFLTIIQNYDSKFLKKRQIKFYFYKFCVILCIMKITEKNIENRYEKKEIPNSIGRKNFVMKNILALTRKSHSFLLLGHSYSDEDCVSSMVAAALLLKKFKKSVSIYLQKELPVQLHFFEDMCRYNSINLFVSEAADIEKPDAIVILDTPKSSMVAADGLAEKYLADSSIPKVEIDHHFSSDASYSGDLDYRLTLRASSTCEIIAQICYKLQKHTEILEEYEIEELYSRNIVLAMLTGMIGDAKYGNYLSKRRDKAFYNYFSKKLNNILHKKYYKNSSNIGSMDEIVTTLETLTEKEKKIYDAVIAYETFKDKIGMIILDKKKSACLIKPADYMQFLDIIKRATNDIAEKVCGAGLSVYYDPDNESGLIQFRVRASEHIVGTDFRPILKKLNISDGGGHAGAIGFRVKKNDVTDFPAYVEKVIQEILNIMNS